MDQVPKVLKPMVQRWAPEGYVVSFKVRACPFPPPPSPSFADSVFYSLRQIPNCSFQRRKQHFNGMGIKS